jgi:hypothetical protein
MMSESAVCLDVPSRLEKGLMSPKLLKPLDKSGYDVNRN